MSDNTLKIELESVLDISHTDKLHENLSQGLQANKDTILVGDKVSKLDTAVVQILLSFIQQAKKQNIKVNWQSPSTALLEYAELLNIKKDLQL